MLVRVEVGPREVQLHPEVVDLLVGLLRHVEALPRAVAVLRRAVADRVGAAVSTTVNVVTNRPKQRGLVASKWRVVRQFASC